jgi:glycosyltransferase involved in cell wall biosynthesis
MVERCADVENLEIREVAANPVAVGLAAKGSRIVHAHDGRTVYSALLANLLFGIPYLITRRVVPQQRKSALRTLAYRRAAKVVAISQAVVEALQQRNPWLETVIIPSANSGFASDEQVVAAIRAARPGKILIGHVGALDHSHKGQSTIIEAARIVAETRPDWHFLLCGDGRDEQRFRDEIGGLGNIELVGWIDNVGDYLASFDVFVFPSLHEALGSTLLDVLQFGLPIIASNVGGIPGIVTDNVNGILVEPEDPQGLVDAIAKIVDDADLREEMRRRNLELARDYSAEKMADAYERLYLTL